MYVFFFKQKTAYEMRISDWSSDVCSSDLLRCGLLGRSLLRRSLLRRSLLGCGLLGWGLLGRRLLGRCHPFLLWLVWYGIVGRLGLGGLSHRDWDDTWDGQVDTAAWGVERMDHELVAHAGAQHLARASGGGVAEVLEGQVAACALGEDVGAVRGEALDLALDGRPDRVAGHELDQRHRPV